MNVKELRESHKEELMSLNALSKWAKANLTPYLKSVDSPLKASQFSRKFIIEQLTGIDEKGGCIAKDGHTRWLWLTDSKGKAKTKFTSISCLLAIIENN